MPRLAYILSFLIFAYLVLLAQCANPIASHVFDLVGCDNIDLDADFDGARTLADAAIGIIDATFLDHSINDGWLTWGMDATPRASLAMYFFGCTPELNPSGMTYRLPQECLGRLQEARGK